MISPSNLPSPAGYSFGSYEPIIQHPQEQHQQHRLDADQQPADSSPAAGADPRQQQHQLSAAEPSAHRRQGSVREALAFNNNDPRGTASSASVFATDLLTDTSAPITNNSSNNSDEIMASPAALSSSTTAAAGAGVTGTPSTTFQISAPAASLSVALCRSVVLKYIYLTYLCLCQLLALPSAAVQKILRQWRSRGRGQVGEAGVQAQGQVTGTGTGIVGVGAVGEKFLQTYTLDNHLGHYHVDGNKSSNKEDVTLGNTMITTTTITTSSYSNTNNGNSMLRRSSRFKSRSDLEEIAQSSSSSSILNPSARRNSGPGSRSSFSNVSTAVAAASGSGYGTDSMVEDGSGDNSARGGFNSSNIDNTRLRQRTGRPVSGLGVLQGHGHGHGGIGSRKKTLVLDLDETLIHSTSRGSRAQGYMVEVLVDRHACLYYVYKRPHVDYFLKKVSEWYKLVIFTASMAEYADPVIDWLDQSRTLFEKRYFRQACFFRNGSYLKDLTVIDQDLSSVCLLDNSPVSYSLNKENGIPIDSWIDDPTDEALLDLLPFLDALRFTEDVRSILSLRTI